MTTWRVEEPGNLNPIQGSYGQQTQAGPQLLCQVNSLTYVFSEI
jgi:hypothetical protein